MISRGQPNIMAQRVVQNWQMYDYISFFVGKEEKKGSRKEKIG
jgi:hypothetical protein